PGRPPSPCTGQTPPVCAASAPPSRDLLAPGKSSPALRPAPPAVPYPGIHRKRTHLSAAPSSADPYRSSAVWPCFPYPPHRHWWPAWWTAPASAPALHTPGSACPALRQSRFPAWISSSAPSPSIRPPFSPYHRQPRLYKYLTYRFQFLSSFCPFLFLSSLLSSLYYNGQHPSSIIKHRNFFQFPQKYVDFLIGFRKNRHIKNRVIEDIL